MQIGVIFSQADSGTDPEAIRTWVRTAEAAGFDHLLAYDHVLGASAERLGPGPFGSFASAPYTNEHVFHEIRRRLDAVADPGLDAVLAAKPELDAHVT